MRRQICAIVFVFSLCGFCTAQSQYVSEIYGDGVHAYFRCEKFAAQQQFDLAIQNGLQDPRVFYFRALIHLQHGDCYSAEGDIRTGVMYELRGLGTYDIGRALERVQGPERIEFERLRLLAKLDLSRQPVADRVPGIPEWDRDAGRRETEIMIPDSPFILDEALEPDASDLDLDTPDSKVAPVDEPVIPPQTDKPDPFVDDDESAAPGVPDADADAMETPGEQPTSPAEIDDPFADDPFGGEDL